MIESLNIFKKLEDLIKEHGSASILRDHVNLLREQFSISERKIASLEARVKQLESEVQNCTEEKDRLNEIIKTLQEDQSIKKLGKITEDILQFFFKEAKELDTPYLSSVFSLQQSAVDYHLDILRKNKMIIQTRAGAQVMHITSPPGFSITSKGREYIMKRVAT
jgi:DNA-binding transcriptional ArsR family regulator